MAVHVRVGVNSIISTQLQIQLQRFQLQLQLRPISRISTPTPTQMFQLKIQFQLRQISGISTPTPTPEASTSIPEFQIQPQLHFKTNPSCSTKLPLPNYNVKYYMN